MTRTTYRVAGMTCDGCTSSLKRALGDALQDVEIDVRLEGGLVAIDGEHAAVDVERAVEDAGFDFEGVVAR